MLRRVQRHSEQRFRLLDPRRLVVCSPQERIPVRHLQHHELRVRLEMVDLQHTDG